MKIKYLLIAALPLLPPRQKPTTAGGSDHAYFTMNGVPTLYFSLSDVKGYNFNYDEIWHTENDLFTKSIPEYQEHSTIVTAVVVYGLANLDHLLSGNGLYAEPEVKNSPEPSKK
jgi:Zn-dependent M28 family amino/carboxypeptidase